MYSFHSNEDVRETLISPVLGPRRPGPRPEPICKFVVMQTPPVPAGVIFKSTRLEQIRPNHEFSSRPVQTAFGQPTWPSRNFHPGNHATNYYD
ncbi:hypothetical protein GWI33_015753 [Rhynchophorus ferrugineus]|uniref:Uncharacterized protein n=1 Tax=Rhynchophorus ferrugineus TaxID=354439 RepID=A0A834I290_RHYFE|nr:hypothetical protein GWI33_015753 [Rhynchophorus ferrugineus]